MTKAANLSNRIIEYSFYALLFFVPLFLTPFNYELFEYNKMMLTYSLASIIVGAWLTRMILVKEFRIQRTPLDIPIAVFLASQVLSTFFSIDRHVSILGYYSRSHGGLLSTLTYLVLYWAAVSNLNKRSVIRALQFGLLGGTLVATYGIAEHFGIDAQYWMQDVKNRVFSTLGQPNWLAAYLSILIPFTVAFGLQNLLSTTTPHGKNHEDAVEDRYSRKAGLGIKDYWGKKNLLYSLFIILPSLFYLCLLYTKSRSGFSGFWAGNLIFWGILALKFRKEILKWLIILNSTVLILTFIVGSPFAQINKYFSLEAITTKLTNTSPAPIAPPPPGGTESGEIRKIVWKGAVDVWQHYPILGSGVETFAFSYYQYRPVEHNMVSEWDFLYNKAHNEYLNFLATTGVLGLGSYLLIIGWFLWWNIKKISNFKFLISKQIPPLRQGYAGQANHKSQQKLDTSHSLEIRNWSLVIALLAAYISILVSNFFGFSVVVVALFFFLIPAFSFILSGAADQNVGTTHPGVNSKKQSASPQPSSMHLKPDAISRTQFAKIIIVLFAICYTLYAIFRLWQADFYFAKGYNFTQTENYIEAYEPLKQAIRINPSEPLYRDELSYTAAVLALTAAQERQATEAAELTREAIAQNRKALETSPQNVNFWKTRTRVFYTLSALNEDYNKEALDAIQMAQKLAPTDAKIAYNLAVIQGRVGETETAIKTLEETIRLKPDYRDAHYALALYLQSAGKNEESAQHLRYILEKISPEDEQVKELLGQQETKH
ncbi:MAG: O-antigen ligase family protein [bacterium]|nr:O-antigen ligase family protein [bacterium]